MVPGPRKNTPLRRRIYCVRKKERIEMNRLSTLIVAAGGACAVPLAAQNNPFSADAKQSYTGTKNTLLKAADKMPEQFYSFRTTDKVRTYAEIMTHIADTQMILCGMAKGEQKKGDAGSKTSKADVIAALKASFDYCDEVYNSINDADGAAKLN